MSLAALEAAVWCDRRLVVCVGPGGVGKTSLSAALAIAAAAERRVALLTIDPARRLANALGLDALDDRLRPVAGVDNLWAAMLDTKASFDALVARIATPEQLDRITENAVYDAFSRTLARSHAYIAMERLFDLLHDPRFDLIVLDTPPSRSALDILDAPGRLLDFLDDETLSTFIGPGWVGRGVRQTGEVALRLLSLLAGRGLVGEMRGFFELFLPMRAGFGERAAATTEALRARSTAFVLVTAPDQAHLHDARSMRAGLRERGLSPVATLFNRAFAPSIHGEPIRSPLSEEQQAQLLARLHPEAGPQRQATEHALAQVARLRNEAARRTLRHEASIGAFLDEASGGAFALPWLSSEPSDVEALAALVASVRVADARGRGR